MTAHSAAEITAPATADSPLASRALIRKPRKKISSNRGAATTMAKTIRIGGADEYACTMKSATTGRPSAKEMKSEAATNAMTSEHHNAMDFALVARSRRKCAASLHLTRAQTSGTHTSVLESVAAARAAPF